MELCFEEDGASFYSDNTSLSGDREQNRREGLSDNDFVTHISFSRPGSPVGQILEGLALADQQVEDDGCLLELLSEVFRAGTAYGALWSKKAP